VEEPSAEATLAILRGLKERYESHHGVEIRDSALQAAVALSSRYITDRYQPDKSIDLVDEACAGLRMQQESRPEGLRFGFGLVIVSYRLSELEREQREVLMLKMEESSVAKEGASSRLQELRQRIAAKEERVRELEQEWLKEKKQLDTLKHRKRDLAAARLELEKAQRAGDWTR
jgi:ATP-dependent Clp protease ATP-binding subunit ClpB